MRSNNRGAEENTTNIVPGDKSTLSTMAGSVGLSGLPISDAFSPTFSSTENEEKDLCPNLVSEETNGGKHSSNQRLGLGKRTHPLNRSDSTGSSKGRKFLTPTSSNPQRSMYTEKDRFYNNTLAKKEHFAMMSSSIITDKKVDTKNNYFNTPFSSSTSNQVYQPLLNNNNHFDSKNRILITTTPSRTVSQLLTNNKLLPFNMQVNVVYEVHDWWQEQVLMPQMNDDKCSL